MNNIWTLKVGLSALLAVIIVNALGNKKAYDHLISAGFLIPGLFFIALLVSLMIYRTSFGRGLALQWACLFLSTVLIMMVYYLILSAAYPVLRKHLNAKSVVQLWILPNFLYLFFVHNTLQSSTVPLFIIKLPDFVLQYVFPVWSIGFMGVILYRIILHMIYRKRIMTDLIPPSEDVASLWEKVFTEAIPERKGALRKRKITELWISLEVKTPLTVGIIKRVVLLPAHDYSKKELSIIFRHELVHIRRSDTGTRFYMAFCNAVFWFFPPIWKRISHMAEDIELSCDETILEEADNDARKEYAELILKTAGDNHGFTTALSTTAASLKYRMEQILHPVKRGNGAALTGMLLFPLMVVNSSTAYTYHPQTVNDLLFHDHAVSLNYVYRYGVGTNIAFNCTDEERLLKCLGEFEISSLSCPSAIPTDLTADRLNIVLDSDDEQYTIAVQEGFLMLYRKQNLTSREVYVLEKGSMDDLMVFLESDTSRDYRQLLPVLTLQFGEQDDSLSVRCDGEVGGGSAPANDGTYNYSTEDLWAKPVILHDIHSDSVQLIFSQEFISCRVQYTPADYYHEYYSAEHHTPLDIQPEWTYVDYADGDLLPLAGPGTHYWIRVKFLNGNELDEKTEQAMNLTLPPGISVTDWYEMFFMFEIQ